MNFLEATKLMIEGKKMRRPMWIDKNQYVCLDKNWENSIHRQFVDNTEEIVNWLTSALVLAEDWEIYRKREVFYD